MQAAVLSVKLRHLDDWIRRRREIAREYDQGLAELSDIVLPPACTDSGKFFDVYQNYVIEADDRDGLHEHLAERRIETMISWPKPVPHQPGLGLDEYKLPATESLCDRVLSLPMYPEMSQDEVGRV